MPMGYPHLTHPERSQIYALKSTGRSFRQINEPLGRHVSQMSRLRGLRDYRHSQAHGKAFAGHREIA